MVGQAKGGAAPANLAGGQPNKQQQPLPPPALASPGGAERGTPSPFLQQAQGGVLDDGSGDYEVITEAAAESGVYRLVGGYLDEDGVVHSEVHVHSISGDEEELLGNENIDILDRLTSISIACTDRIGTITDKGKIAQAIHRLPMGSHTHLLISLRRVTHWKRHKDIYEMDVRCPIEDCRKEGSYKVNLGTLETFEMADPAKRETTEKLLDCGSEVVWRVAGLPQSRVFQAVRRLKGEDHKILSFSIMARLVTLDGQDVRLKVEDFVPDGSQKKLLLSKRAEALYNVVRKWTSGDRDQLRESFYMNEPSVETDLEFECQHCKREFRGELDVTQRTFFFPSATSRRSKQRSSI
jgi:hypothetical protein